MTWRWPRRKPPAGRKVAARTACWRSAIRCAPIFRGAHAIGVDFLFVTSGIHAEELGGRERPDSATMNATFAAAGEMPKAVMRELTW